MIEHRKELRKKVEQRAQLLQAALKVSESEGHPAGRLNALTTELTVVSDSVGGGWERMSDSTAERLTEWLETTTRYLT
jgi:hypothetical protein